MKLEAIRFRYRGLEPAREIEVEPLLYSARSGRLVELKAVGTRDLDWRDALLFDSKFSGTLTFSYADLLHGEHEAEVVEYDVPEESTKVVEVLRVSEGRETEYVALVYTAGEKTARLVGRFESLEQALESSDP